jgi:hypothetical protein
MSLFMFHNMINNLGSSLEIVILIISMFTLDRYFFYSFSFPVLSRGSHLQIPWHSYMSRNIQFEYFWIITFIIHHFYDIVCVQYNKIVIGQSTVIAYIYIVLFIVFLLLSYGVTSYHLYRLIFIWHKDKLLLAVE